MKIEIQSTKHFLEEALKNSVDNMRDLTLDLQKLQYLSSTGLRCYCPHKKHEQAGGDNSDRRQ